MRSLRSRFLLTRFVFGLSLLSIPICVLGPAAASAQSINACAAPDKPFKVPFVDLKAGAIYQCQDKRFTLGDPSQLQSGDDGSGSLRFEWNLNPPGGYENDFFSLDFDFSPSRRSTSSAGFSYVLEVTDPEFVLDTVQLDSTMNQLGSQLTSSVTKAVIALDPSGLPSGLPPLELVSASDRVEFSFVGAPTRISVTDTWVVGTGSTIVNFKNTFTQVSIAGPPASVPGPLPVLGAGAAFGFSRRLRSRIKASRLT